MKLRVFKTAVGGAILGLVLGPAFSVVVHQGAFGVLAILVGFLFVVSILFALSLFGIIRRYGEVPCNVGTLFFFYTLALGFGVVSGAVYFPMVANAEDAIMWGGLFAVTVAFSYGVAAWGEKNPYSPSGNSGRRDLSQRSPHGSQCERCGTETGVLRYWWNRDLHQRCEVCAASLNITPLKA